MNSILSQTCETFIKNRDLLRENFRHEGMVMHLMGAAVMTATGGRIGIREYKKCEEFIDSRAGVLSSLRGVLKMPMIVNMASAARPDQYFDKVQKVYADIKESMGSKDERLFLAAMSIAAAADDEDEISAMIEAAARIYDKTDAAGRLFSDLSEYVTAASAAVAGVRDAEAFAEELALCKEKLDSPSKIGKVPEDLCILLAAQEGSADEKCARVREISASLGDKKIGLGSSDAASMLAVLAGLDMSADEIAEEVCAADKFLREQKGFGLMGVGTTARQMYAAILVCIACGAADAASDLGSSRALSDAVQNRFVTSSMLLNQQVTSGMLIQH